MPATGLPRTDPIVVPATAERWADVVTLLGGATEQGCWCQSWRGSPKARGFTGPAANRDALQAQVESGGFAPGVIAYLDGEPVGWCGLGPRAAMPRLVNSRTIPTIDDLPVWSIGCFVVRVGYRRRGVARALLAGAIEYARSPRGTGHRGLPDRSRRGSRLDLIRVRRVHLDVRGGRLSARRPDRRPQRRAAAMADATRVRLAVHETRRVDDLEVGALDAAQAVQFVVVPMAVRGAGDVPRGPVVGEEHPVLLERPEDDL